MGQAGVLAGHRPGLPGIPERRRGVARAADWGQGGGPPGDGTTTQARYYISRLDVSAKRLLEVVRAHRSVENPLHWSLDVAFREDQSRVRKAHGAQNMATLRQISHNLLKREATLKAGIQGKRLQAGGREDYLLKVLIS